MTTQTKTPGGVSETSPDESCRLESASANSLDNSTDDPLCVECSRPLSDFFTYTETLEGLRCEDCELHRPQRARAQVLSFAARTLQKRVKDSKGGAQHDYPDAA